MNNQKELTIEDYQNENQFLKVKIAKLTQAFANQTDYTMDLETELHLAQSALEEMNKQEQQGA